MSDTLADRLNRIISEQNITKREFARRIGVGETYVYVLTRGGRSNHLNQNISPMLARVIATEFGYDPEWLLHGEAIENTVVNLRQNVIEQIENLSSEELLKLKKFLDTLNNNQ